MSDWLVGDNYTRWQVSQWSLKCYLQAYFLRDFELPLRCIWYRHSFGILGNVELSFRTEVSEQTVGPIFRSSSPRTIVLGVIVCLEASVLNYHSSLRKIPKHQISYFIWRRSFLDFVFKPDYCFVVTSSQYLLTLRSEFQRRRFYSKPPGL